MKKTTLFTLVSALTIFTGSAMANFSGPGAKATNGFNGPNQGPTTVEQILNNSSYVDDTPVILSGFIKERIGGEYYTFQDNTGTIRVEIDHEDWPNDTITPETKVSLYGEVDVKFSRKEVDVDYIRVE